MKDIDVLLLILVRFTQNLNYIYARLPKDYDILNDIQYKHA